MVVMCLEGECILTVDGDTTPLHRGETVLVAASATGINVSGNATLLTATA